MWEIVSKRINQKMFFHITSDTNIAERDIALCIEELVPDGCHSRKRLNCADFVLETSEACLLIERKSVVDLSQSISDGRLDDQVHRMLEVAKSTPRIDTKVGILVCGSPPRGEVVNGSSMKTSSFYGKLYSLQMNKGVTVFWCANDLDEISKRIVQIGKQMVIDLERDAQVTHSITNSMMQCGKRKRTAEKDNVQEITKSMLRGIPGVSVHICNALIEKYSTISKLRKLSETELASVEVGSNDKIKRKLGPVLAKRMFNVLCM